MSEHLQWIVPSLITLLGGIVGVVIWLIRLEGNQKLIKQMLDLHITNVNKDLEDFTSKHEGTRQWLGKHVGNEQLHIGQRFFEEFSKRFDAQDRRLQRIEDKLDHHNK